MLPHINEEELKEEVDSEAMMKLMTTLKKYVDDNITRLDQK